MWRRLFSFGLALALVQLCACPADVEGDDPGECSDGADNDRDLMFDCDDPDCAASPACDGVVDDDDDNLDDDDSGPPDDDDAGDDDSGGDDDDAVDDDDSTIDPGDVVLAEPVVLPGDDPCYAGAWAAEDLSSVEIDFSCDPTYAAFEEGDVLVGVDGDVGYLVWVDEVAQAGDTWVAQTHPAGLLDLFEQATWDVLLEDWLEERNPWTINETVSAGPLSVTLTGTLGVTPNVRFEGDIEGWLPPKLKTFYTSVGGSTTGSITADITATAATTHEGEKQLASVTAVKKVFMIGIVPVMVGLDLNVTLRYTFEASASASAQVGFQFSGMFEIGGQYSQSGGWSGINNSNFTASAVGPTITAVEGLVQARVGVQVAAVMTLYTVDGPYIDFEPYGTACLYLDATVPQVTWAYAYGIDLGAGIKLTILGHELADEEISFPGFPMSLGGDTGTWTP